MGENDGPTMIELGSNDLDPAASPREPGGGDDVNSGRPTTKQLLKFHWKILLMVLWPLALLPLAAQIAPEYALETRCAYVILVMAVFWVSECLPLAITAMIPLFAFPLLGILDSSAVCSCYMNDTIVLFIGTLILALAIEHSGLHLRIALAVMLLVGCSHQRLLAGIIAVTMLLSMWISNTATCAMLVPIVFALLKELESQGLGRVFFRNADDEDEPTDVTKAYLLGIAYASTYGGTTTLIGTGTNLVFKGIYEETFPGSGGLGFSEWILMTMPQAWTNALLTWIYLLVCYLGVFRPGSRSARDAHIGPEGSSIAYQVVLDHYRKLGPVSFHEGAVGCMFLFCIFLWFFRQPGFARGWSDLLNGVDIKDSSPAILVVVLLFVMPRSLRFKPAGTRETEGLITWHVVEEKMPWALIFVLGGGFAIARGCAESCLSQRIAEALTPLGQLHRYLLIFLVCLFTGTLTELTSNIGVANVLLPIVAQMSSSLRVHPLLLMLPCTLMCSYSFRSPVGTPPNALITLTGHLPTRSLVLGGCGTALYTLLVVALTVPPWLALVLPEAGEFPRWAERSLARHVALEHCAPA